jgi:glutaredoxin-related protein
LVDQLRRIILLSIDLAFRTSLLALLIAMPALASADAETGIPIVWTSTHDDGASRVHLYFFWSQKCPHCLKALPFIDAIDREHGWLEVDSAEISQSRQNAKRYIAMADSLGLEARSVPAFFVCGRMITGYDSPAGTGQDILALAQACKLSPGTAPEQAQDKTQFSLPFVGTFSPQGGSLLTFTLIIAGMDSFNPCAFFVLLFLLSLMVHARSRARMLLIGTTFVVISALVYFMFMAAWLNLFMMLGAIPVITVIAGAIAIAIGLINTKDYFLFKQGPSLSLPEAARPALFRRMRELLKADRIPAMLLGTAALAVAANSYELLCTAGFPMVYTRMLTLSELGAIEYYAYLLLYNLVYVLPLLAIVLVFSFTLGTRKLSERQGRFLKLLSGLMMFGLGLMLLFAPDTLLTSIWPGLFLLLIAAAAATTIHRLTGSDQRK